MSTFTSGGGGIQKPPPSLPPSQIGQSSGRLTKLQRQVDEATDIMRESTKKIMERGPELKKLKESSENLTDKTKGFRNIATRIRKKYWWKNTKMIIIGISGVILFLIIAVSIFTAFL